MKKLQKFAILLFLVTFLFTFSVAVNAAPDDGIAIEIVAEQVGEQAVVNLYIAHGEQILFPGSIRFQFFYNDHALTFVDSEHSGDVGNWYWLFPPQSLGIPGSLQVSLQTPLLQTSREGLMWTATFDINPQLPVGTEISDFLFLYVDGAMTPTRGGLPTVQVITDRASFVVEREGEALNNADSVVTTQRAIMAISANPAFGNLSTGELTAIRQWQITGGFTPTTGQLLTRENHPEIFTSARYLEAVERFLKEVYILHEGELVSVPAIMATATNPLADNLSAGDITNIRQWHAVGGFTPTAAQQQLFITHADALQTPRFQNFLQRANAEILTERPIITPQPPAALD